MTGVKNLDLNRALVLFSGGQDSTTSLAFALEKYDYVETVGFDYGQRNKIELDCRLEILSALKQKFPQWASKIGDDHLLDLLTFASLSNSALTDHSQDITVGETGLPTTFVPGRNLFFFTYAAVIAYNRNLGALVGGMCETDFSGYPDCREETLKYLVLTLNHGMGTDFEIDTPLMWKSKAQSWELAHTLGGDALISLIRTSSHTCYNGVREELHDFGYGCQSCPACELRAKGYAEWRAKLQCNWIKFHCSKCKNHVPCNFGKVYKTSFMYQVKEIFYTLQGEGTHSGRAAVFMRFSGCNLWTGREVDRSTAICQFCDTDFVGVDGENGGKYTTAEELALKAYQVATGFKKEESETLEGLLIVLTGGEPLLQVDEPLIDALHEQGFEIAVETNGTIKAPSGLDWVCVSPKAGSDIIQKSGNELKLVYGQEEISPEQFEAWEFDHFYLQPMDISNVDTNEDDTSNVSRDDNERLTNEVIEYCKVHPKWKLSLQTHKILNIA